MTPAKLRKLDRELNEFLDSMTVGLGRTEGRRALGGYVTDLLLDGERKSIEPMAARLVEEPGQTEAMRQRLQQCGSGASWEDSEMRRRLAQQLERELPPVYGAGLRQVPGMRSAGARLRAGALRELQGQTARRLLVQGADCVDSVAHRQYLALSAVFYIV